VTFIGLYHSKPLGSERPWKEAVTRARELGVHFPIAYDHHWQTVRRWWLDGQQRPATSSSFIIGRDGRIAFVHPGPLFFPSEDPTEAQADADYKAIRAALKKALRRAP
jgi:peroxiredoxin